MRAYEVEPKANFVRGVAFRLLLPHSSKLAARTILKRELNARPNYFPTMKLMRQTGITEGFEKIDKELIGRNYKISKAIEHASFRFTVYFMGGMAAEPINRTILSLLTFTGFYFAARFLGFLFENDLIILNFKKEEHLDDD